ncbi:FAD binding domain-containing protein [Zopfia rhizophila CBS 207.26]|uniref:FAD binding domain-containing protein n=1 Tax=Zopfia rhizophila CBS 207.26 TaxID=1314779 RepID=A0A6A6DFB3_9PEZI|nr:FAD binding domain-containing protein [Zopfia rhizophila CBS 207.26]
MLYRSIAIGMFGAVLTLLLGRVAAGPPGYHNCCTALQQALPDNVFYSNSSTYDDSVNSYWAAQETQLRPLCVISVHNTEHVQQAVSVLAKLNENSNACPFAIRAGGHGKSGNSNQHGGVNIDLRGLNSVSLSADGKVASLGSGVTWQAAYLRLDERKLTVPGGRDGTMGTGGLSLAGGVSYVAPQVGFACDNVLNLEVVLSTGKVVNTSATSNSELHKALRGGGNSFGIVTRIDMETLPLENMWGGTTYYDISTYNKQLQAFYSFAADPKYDEKAYMYQSFGFNSQATVALNNFGYAGAAPELPSKLKAFNDITPSLFSTVRVSNLSEFTFEQAVASPPGFRQITFTTTFKNNLEILQASFEIWNATLSKVGTIQGITYSWSLEPLPPSILSKSAVKSGNMLGLSDADGPLVLSLLSDSYANVTDDTLIWDVTKKVITDIESHAIKLDVFHRWKYAGYAAKGQYAIQSYGENNVRALKRISRAYDHKQLFQNAVPGGFKLR